MFENCLKCPNFEICVKKYDNFADFCRGADVLQCQEMIEDEKEGGN